MTTRRSEQRLLQIALPAALLIAAVAPASADDIRLDRPMAAASLHDGGVDMVVYYLDHQDELEVVATYSQKGAYEPARLRMALGDGDDVSFGLPGLSGASYRFTRTGAVVSVSAKPTPAVPLRADTEGVVAANR